VFKTHRLVYHSTLGRPDAALEQLDHMRVQSVVLRGVHPIPRPCADLVGGVGGLGLGSTQWSTKVSLGVLRDQIYTP